MRRILVAAALAVLALVLWAPAASAHPLGNAATNQHVGLRVTPDAIHVDYVLDLAELPTYQTCKGQGCASETAAKRCAAATANLRITIGERVRKPFLHRSALTLSTAAAGLDTLRLECSLSVDAALGGETSIRVRNDAFPGTIGWREVTATGDRTTLVSSDVPAASASERLTDYPDDLLSSPPDLRRATLVVRPGGPAIGQQDSRIHLGGTQLRALDRISVAYTAFVTDRRSSIPFVILAVLASVVLGGMHALAPGHGKTLMAAYAIGSRGTRRQLGVIGLTVAATHTMGVVVLGVFLTITSTASEQIYPWLAAASGVLLVLVGISLLRAALRHRGLHAGTPTTRALAWPRPRALPRAGARAWPRAFPSP